ncbi:MetQ/NlpA family ABC transporter substrate-binding protein [Leucobacter komagatae]|uniref:MetQ/NlpA family ABC transporter substrate-binding protein n=1 Tax=Leucobacter komagatae TaxID=55969 RepID=UPI0006968658|nr:MetQ/NlpA family ABC transporter substrate-binding protein [Leucobacter komagatae]
MKKNLRAIAAITAALGLAASLAACSSDGAGDAGAADEQDVTVQVGILSREQPEIEFLAKHLKEEGITLEFKSFDDNIALNRATAEGSLDANFFQNATYLKAQNESTGQNLQAYGDWLQTSAVQFVSSKYDSIDALPDGASIGIANDQANRARELQLLESNGLIELKAGVELPSTLDITANPKNIKWVEVDPRSRVGAFPDLDAMTAPAITVYLMEDPSVNALAEETPEVYETYGGVLWVVAEGTTDLPWLDTAIEFMQSDTYKDWLADHYKNIKKTPQAS